ncbi:DNA polymerase kappa [Thraustotheca clavata]|uniref:DNA polymerase kappa n=1 Tax=Thraustotheca clavata TaxID=74557 RepID=A0A1W0ACF3_9STRA|nr:DNA polymerase kappa [Thraustotheca clavata]
MTDHLFVFSNPKAGMDNIDRTKVNETIYNLSKDSAFFKNTLEKDAKTDAKIAAMKAQLLTKRKHDLTENVDNLVSEYEAKRRFDRIYVVVDMDMFFAAVEMRDRPELAKVPMAVGGMGMISTANYEARKHGVRAAMPGFIGKKLCPDLVFVKPNMAKYAAVAEQTRQIFADYDPNFTAASMDEAYLDITDVCTARGGADDASREDVAAAITSELRQRIFEATKLTASAGISSNAKLAKVCSDINKPNGQYVLPFNRESIVKFIENLPIRKLGGIGKVREKVLAALGITNGLELFNARYDLFHVYSDITARWLLEISMGVYEGGSSHDERKSVSRESTFKATSSLEELKNKCKQIVEHVKKDLIEEQVTGMCVTFKLKTEAFSVRTRAFTSKASVEPNLLDIATMLLEREVHHDQKVHKEPPRYRLMGVRISKLVDRSEMTTSTSNQLRLEETKLFQQDKDGECPVCQQVMAKSKLNRHINECLNNEPKEEEGKAVECPVCQVQFHGIGLPWIKSHIIACEKANKRRNGDSELQSKRQKISENLCPVCSQSFESRSQSWISQHLEICVPDETKPSHLKNDNSVPTQAICPICNKTLENTSTQLINAHVDACLQSPKASTIKYYFRQNNK